MNESTPNFGGLVVGCFESRRGTDMAALIAKYGGVARVSPSLREVEIRENPSAKTFIHELLTGNIDVVIFLTGVGFKHLLTAVEKIVPRQRYLDALTDVVTICRGPKPTAAMKEVGLTPTHRVPEPNTWRDLLATIDAGIPIYNQGIALQEYGKSNTSLIGGLESRGARVLQVRVYEWELPEDIAPLEANVKALAAGELDVILFTSAHQAVNLITIAQRLNLMPQVEAALRTTVVASIGPTDERDAARSRLARRHRAAAPQDGASRDRRRGADRRNQETQIRVDRQCRQPAVRCARSAGAVV